MSIEEVMTLSIFLIGGSVALGSIDKLRDLYDRNDMLKKISNDIFVDSYTIKMRKDEIEKQLTYGEVPNDILKHLALFEKSYSKDELILLRKNLETLKINKNVLDYSGTYDPFKNTISVLPSSFNTFNHEFHHAASNLGFVNGFVIVGFQQFNDDISIGRGINESYAEYLSKNMLGLEKYSYKKTVDLIPLIEELYEDKNELRQAYFDANLPAVIKKFEDLSTREESLALIRDIDKLWIYDNYKAWFDKSKILELSIRIRLYDYYKKLTGCNNKEDLFFDENMLEKISSKTKILK